MAKRKNMLVTGLVVAAVMTAGLSVYAAGDVVEDTAETVRERVAGFAGGMRGDKSARGDKASMMGRQGGGNFETAVEEGILTQAEADAIMAFQEENKADMEAVKEETADMDREEARAYMQENYAKADLVEEGLLSQDQADALEALKPEGMEGRAGMRGQKGGNNFEAAIEAGILTQDEADAITAYCEENGPDFEAIKEETADMDREAAKAYIEENYPKVDLVEAGLLTQDQVDELEELKSVKPEFDGERPEFDGERPEGMEDRGSRGQGRGMRGTTEDSTETTDL